MTWTKIQNEYPEIAKEVKAKHPKTKRERQGCATEIAKNEYKRWMCAKRMIDDRTAV